MPPTRTPDNIAIHKRNWKFGREEPARRWWHGGDAGRTAFFNALSSTFPVGEKFFMTTVRYYRDEAPEALRQQIDDFVYQESMHTREHVFFNKQAREAGYDIRSGEDRAARTIAWAKRRKPVMQLAATCALEHFTATLANAVLSNPEHLAGAEPEAQRMWRWHAIEEIEHKASRTAAATAAVVAMAAATVRFHYVVFRNTADLLAQDGKNDLSTWRKLLHYLYVRPGAMRLLVGSAIGDMRPGFHPWQHDDRALVARALDTLTPPADAEMAS